jgi:hypothetical protein
MLQMKIPLKLKNNLNIICPAKSCTASTTKIDFAMNFFHLCQNNNNNNNNFREKKRKKNWLLCTRTLKR